MQLQENLIASVHSWPPSASKQTDCSFLEGFGIFLSLVILFILVVAVRNRRDS